MSNIDPLLERIIDAHGGADLWRSTDGIEAELSVDGFLFTTKRRPPLLRTRVWASTRDPHFVFHDYPRPGLRGELLGDEEVRILDAGGQVIARREQPRTAFRGLRRELYWDDLDFLYFGGYATWNYLTTPFLFMRPGFGFELLSPNKDGTARLRVTFPPDIPTHCRQQVFHIAPDGRLARLDYTAEVVGGWAHAAHICSDYANFNGLWAPRQRRVRPLFHLSKPLPLPTLVAIDVHDLRPMAIKTNT